MSKTTSAKAQDLHSLNRIYCILIQLNFLPAIDLYSEICYNEHSILTGNNILL